MNENLNAAAIRDIIIALLREQGPADWQAAVSVYEPNDHSATILLGDAQGWRWEVAVQPANITAIGVVGQ